MNSVSNFLDGARPLMQFATAYQTMTIAAGEVFFRRSLMLATGSASTLDVVGMVVEKTATFAEAAGEAMAALVKGEDAVAVATAALEPYGARTAANVRELRG